MLANPTADYFRGFELRQGQRSDRAAAAGRDRRNPQDDISADARIAPVSRLARRFLDACAGGAASAPGLAEGYRVQQLIDAARRAHASGRWIDIAPPQERP